MELSGYLRRYEGRSKQHGGLTATKVGRLPGIPPENWEDQLVRLDRHYATRVDLESVKGDLKTDIAKLETRLIKWMVGMLVAAIAAASTVALLIHRLIE
jgi:hypothetical protein